MFKYLILILFVFCNVYANKYRMDDASNISIDKQIPGSHIKVFIPNLPYIYLSKLINGTLVRSSDNGQGWELMLASKLERKGALVYIFRLREDMKFQDGTSFDADDIVENFKFAMQEENNDMMLYEHLKSVTKLSKYEVKFTLTKPLGRFLFMLARYSIFSKAYLKKYKWGEHRSYTADNLKEPGPYGLGPYTLIEGYSTGRKQTSIIKLKANPYYFEKGMPYIENITIYTELSTKQSLDMVLKNEGKLDITTIPFNKKVESIISPYAKLLTSSSRHNISILMNLMREDSILKDQTIRLALNEAINQEKLLKFVYKGEGVIGPTSVNKNHYSVQKATKGMLTHNKKLWKTNPNPKKYLKSILNGLELNVVTMEQMMFLWRGIEYQLSLYGVKINYTITKNEIELFDHLLTNWDKPKKWDLLSWASDSWSSDNPWSVFFHYHTTQPWSSIARDDLLQKHLEKYLQYDFNSDKFLKQTKIIIDHVYNKAYLLSVPAPNIVLAVNKEVDYEPSAVLQMPLWKAKLTPFHWSIRKDEYPKERFLPIEPKRYKK